MAELKELLSYLRALYQLEQHYHWSSKGENYYGDHLLFNRLYDETEKMLDSVAEKSIGLFGKDAIEVGKDAELTKELVSKWRSEFFSQSALQAIKETLVFIDTMMKQLRDSDKITEGLENMVQGIADKLEGHVYLLTQRIGISENKVTKSLVDLANKLDKKGAYIEADEIDLILFSLAAKDREAIEFEMAEILDNIRKIEKRPIDEDTLEYERLAFLRERYRSLEKELLNLGDGDKIKIKDMIWSGST